MANKNRKTRKEPTFRARFSSAADAKGAQEYLAGRPGLELERVGKVIEVPESMRRKFDNALNRAGLADWDEVRGRGRPPKSEQKVPSRTSKKSGPKPLKTREYVVLTPAGSDAIKLSKKLNSKLEALEIKRDGARVVIRGGELAPVTSAVKKAARLLQMPVSLEKGFDESKTAKAGKPVVSKKPIHKVLPTLKGNKSSRRLTPNRVKKPSERTKPALRLEIKSSTLARAWYNVETKRLTVEFLNGGKYRYERVSLKEFIAFTTAESQGSWFASNIKDVKETTKLKSS